MSTSASSSAGITAPKKRAFFTTSVFKKVLMAITGLALVGFTLTHLIGNVLLYSSSGELFNNYAHKLMKMGFLLYIAEAGLAGFFLLHAITGIRLALSAKTATPSKYAVSRTKGGESKWGWASNNMAITGSILLIFLILHVKHFKFGPGITEGYVATLESGEQARDLFRYVREEFKNFRVVALYTIVMLALGFHLRHGVWSAVQSLGLTRENNTKKIYLMGGLIGILLGAGFLMIPLYVYFFAN